MRVTVIATGFPTAGMTSQRSPQLFGFGGRDTKEKDGDLPPAPAIGKIYNAPSAAPTSGSSATPPTQSATKEKEEPAKIGGDIDVKKKIEVNDDDEWSAVPSFLRRPKIK